MTASDMQEIMKVVPVNIGYVKGKLPDSIYKKIVDMEPTMYDNDGSGQYVIDNIKDQFEIDSAEYLALDALSSIYDYLEV